MRTKPRPYDHRTPPVVVKPATAAQMMDCSRQHVYALIERGELRRVSIGNSKSVRVPVSDIWAVLGLEQPDSGDVG